MTDRDSILSDVITKIDDHMLDFDYLELAQDIWDASKGIVAQEDRIFREHLQWLEGNLDTLVHINAPNDAINLFLSEQKDLIILGMRDANALESAHWKGAIEYVESNSNSDP